MSYAGYVIAGYGITAVALIAYTWRLVSRGRRATVSVPAERRRWM